MLSPAPDISVIGPSSVAGILGAPLQLSYIVANAGAAPGHNTVASLTFPDGGASLTALTTSAGSCSTATASCSLGTVHPGDRITVAATVLPAANMVDVNVTASETEHDAQQNNNSVDTTISSSGFSLRLSPSSLTIQPGFAPSTLTPGSNTVSTTLTVTVPSTASLASPTLKRRQDSLLLALAAFANGRFCSAVREEASAQDHLVITSARQLCRHFAGLRREQHVGRRDGWKRSRNLLREYYCRWFRRLAQRGANANGAVNSPRWVARGRC